MRKEKLRSGTGRPLRIFGRLDSGSAPAPDSPAKGEPRGVAKLTPDRQELTRASSAGSCVIRSARRKPGSLTLTNASRAVREGLGVVGFSGLIAIC